MGVNILLLDSETTMMPAKVNVNRLATYMANLKTRSLYSLACFDVTRGVESFRFRNHSELLGLASTNTQLSDIVGEITAAVKLHKQLESMGGDPRVLVATSINPKIVGVHTYFDKETTVGDSYFYRRVAQDTGLSSAAPLLKSYAKVESLSIAELNEFVISASSQEIDFICTGKVAGIKLDKGWCYVSCSNCTKKLQRTVSAFTYLHYETADGLFVCFDGVMTRMHNMRAFEAGHLLAGDGVNPEDTQAPPFVAGMEGRTYTFQVKVGAKTSMQTIKPLRSPASLVKGGDDDMETTTLVPSRFILRWRLVVVVRCKDSRKLRRRHVLNLNLHNTSNRFKVQTSLGNTVTDGDRMVEA
ncbi:hypothetical protein Bca101_021054 [Brassica carinata]